MQGLSNKVECNNLYLSYTPSYPLYLHLSIQCLYRPFPLMVGRLTQLPHQMMEGMRLRPVYCGIRSTSPHFVVNVMKIIVLIVLTHTVAGMKLFIRHNTCHMWGATENHTLV